MRRTHDEVAPAQMANNAFSKARVASYGSIDTEAEVLHCEIRRSSHMNDLTTN